MHKVYSIIVLAFATAFSCRAQQNDSLPTRRNTVKINLVSSFLYANSAALSYERVIKPNRSWGVMLGYVEFPQLGSLGPSMSTTTIKRNTGIVVGGEYRFYLAKENKYKAPRGVYVGPYVNYFNFNNDRILSHKNSDGSANTATLESSISILNIGAQLGYQFVVNDRWTFDFIFVGPSLSRYALDLKLNGFDPSEEGIVSDEILKALTDRFPLMKDLIENQKVNVNGSNSKWGTGFRYQMNIGYHFGRRKGR